MPTSFVSPINTLLRSLKKQAEKRLMKLLMSFIERSLCNVGKSQLTISEIAFELQFNSASAFGRFFKNILLFSF
jgi:AraC-like DNA-binding protein